MEELTEVITSSEFRPIHRNLFVSSSSLTCVMQRFATDTQRVSSFIQPGQHPLLAERLISTYPCLGFQRGGLFPEIVPSISDVKFGHDGWSTILAGPSVTQGLGHQHGLQVGENGPHS